MKTCGKCKIEKDVSEFGVDKNKRDGFKCFCKACHNKENTRYRKAAPDNYRATNLAYARSPIGRSKQRANNLRRKFWPQLTNDQSVAEYNRLLASQNFCCALCNTPQATFKVALAVDHDHKTGEVRGLLCNKCNRFEVGRHTPESIIRMVKYFKIKIPE